MRSLLLMLLLSLMLTACTHVHVPIPLPSDQTNLIRVQEREVNFVTSMDLYRLYDFYTSQLTAEGYELYLPESGLSPRLLQLTFIRDSEHVVIQGVQLDETASNVTVSF